MNFEAVYNRLFNAVLAYVRGRINIPSAAEDIAARTWQKAWDKRHQFDFSKGLPEQWIFTIARNEVNRYYQWWRVRHFFSIAEEEEQLISSDKTPFEALEINEKNQLLLSAMTALKPRERDLIGLKFQAGFNNRQIAQISELSESNVGTILNRALQKLRAALEDL